MIRKALVYNPYWDSLGGGERYTASVIRLLLGLNYSVDVVWPKNINSDILDRFGINISGVNYLEDYWTSNYDLVFWVSDGSLPLSFAKKTPIHFQFPFRAVNGRSFGNMVKSRFYHFVVNSRFTKSFIDGEYGVNTEVLYPPVDTISFVPAKKTNTILYVGRFSHLTQLKNQKVLLDVFSRISGKLPGWKLILAGGGGVGSDQKLLSQLKNKHKNLPVEFVLNPNFSQLQKLYGQAKIFWSASGLGASENLNPLKVEHFGISVVEAMSAGCVPVISGLGGHKEIITNTSGFLWQDEAELAEITLLLHKHQDLLNFMSKEAVKRSKIFSVACFSKNFLSLL